MAHYEPYHHQQQLFTQPFEMDQDTSMASFDFNTATQFELPFAFADTTGLYLDGLLDHKFDMARSPSSTSDVRATYEVPALHTSGSVGSTSSSTVGSPYSGHTHMMSVNEGYHVSNTSPYHNPAIVCDEQYQPEFVGHFTADLPFPDHDQKLNGSYVDPGMIASPPANFHPLSLSNGYGNTVHQSLSVSPAPSPVPSHHGYSAFSRPVTLDNYSHSRAMQRETSASSPKSVASPRTSLSGDEDDNARRCPHPECGKKYKDIKAHMLTHELVRPERCPLPSCEYYHRGFARKYDRNRHTLTHYKGTMVCGFCPGSGSPAEKSFNRADVFKRHLISVHGVEQNPPNSRRRSPGSPGKKLSSYCHDATGKCSTCSKTFHNAQGFYEHLDDCVLKVVQQEEPTEAVNAARLAEVTGDAALQETFDRNQLSTHTIKVGDIGDQDEDEEDDEDDDVDDDETYDSAAGRSTQKAHKRAIIGGGISKSLKPARRGMTWSKGGVSLVGKGRKRRKNYPPSWGMAADKMKMKKRVLCVYDGPHRLLKDDMMLNNEFEVRVKYGDGPEYVTDLDVATFERAKVYHDATPEEKGVWQPEHDFLTDLNDLMA